jgi:hypothetical protein
MRRDAAAAELTAAGASSLSPIVAVPTDAVVIDVVERAPRPAECRICHLGTDGDGFEVPVSEVITLGCGCKDELGAAHRQCAEAWFRIKGDRYLHVLSSVVSCCWLALVCCDFRFCGTRDRCLL